MENTQTSTEQKDTQNIHTYADTNDKENYPLLIRSEILNTPFTVVGNTDIGFKLQWGRFNLTDALKTEEEVRRWYISHNWEVIMGMIHIYVENYLTFKEQATKEKTPPDYPSLQKNHNEQ